MELAIVYLAAINVLSFACLRSNKKRASFSRYKIGTNTLFLLSLLGGSIGILIGMLRYRYFLEKPLFRYGVPVILALQIMIPLMIVFLFFL